MKICAVICELNPLHNGHRYIFEKAREATGADRLIALMSGHFVQRGTPAVTDAYSRAECALACGADAVIELPVVYAVAAADKFASGAVNIRCPSIRLYAAPNRITANLSISRRISEQKNRKHIKARCAPAWTADCRTDVP